VTDAVQNPGAAKAAPGPRIAAVLLFVTGAILFGQAVTATGEYGFSPSGPALAPVIVTGLWVVVALAYLVESLRAPAEAAEESDDPERVVRGRWSTPFLLLAALIGYAFVLKYTVAGYILATAGFVLVTARLLSSRPAREVIVRDVLVAIGLSVGIYLLFTRLLGIVLPAGVLPL
jgi:putative tricarboxylic transport membrane protein